MIRVVLQLAEVFCFVGLVLWFAWPTGHAAMWRTIRRACIRARELAWGLLYGVALAYPSVPLTRRGRHRKAAQIDRAIFDAWESVPVRADLEHEQPLRELAGSPAPLCGVWLMLDCDNFHTQCSSPAGHAGDHTVTFTVLRAAGFAVRPF